MTSRNIQGFKVIPLYFSKESSSHHDLFVKEHSVQTPDETKPPGQTIFVVNVPPYATEESLKNAFSAAGTVKTVCLQKAGEIFSDLNTLKMGFKIAYIVFEKRESVTKSLKLEHLNPLSSRECPVLVGMNKWIHEYNSSVYNHEKLSEEVNKSIKEHDNLETEKKANEKQEVDDGGWTVVTKSGRTPGLSRKKSVENKIIQKNNVKSMKKHLKNFYTFQLKEEKMKHIIALRKSFQESQEKVNLMKKIRNFKPF